MPEVVADTHAIVWFAFEPSMLSQPAREALRQADAICVSVMTLVEVCYLCEKGRLPDQYFERLLGLFDDSSNGLRLISIDRAIVEAVASVSRGEVPDMPDRIIAATALSLGLTLVSRDRKIQSSAVNTIW